MIYLTPKLNQSFFVYRIQSKETFLRKNSILSKTERLTKKRKEDFLTVHVRTINKDPTKSIRKNANKLKVHEKTVRTAIKQDLNPNDYEKFRKQNKYFLSKISYT